ncbi:glyoxylate/hydroxypyruvate reductase B-like [Sycon ciliatum]|uniref:glyoxylate/hydroxypyruvate reductase B-like n=1 Tax=Sycon ciliatum TaxID=27933 RepID=UPI0031F5FFF8
MAAIVLQCGSTPLPGDLQGPFEEKYRVVKESDLGQSGAAGLAEVQGIIMYGSHVIVDEKLLDQMPALKVVSSVSVGFDHINVAACRARNVAVGTTPGAVDGATADIAWSLLLAAGRLLVQGHHRCTAPDAVPHFDSNWFGKEVYGSTLGVVGMGGVGLAVARRAVGFDMEVLYHNRNRREASVEEKANAEYVSDLKELMSRSDYIVSCIPGSAENKKLFNSEVLSAAKQGSVFVNVSRGVVVDQDALVENLKNGRLYAAGLDVTDPEPLPRDHPLLQLPNVTITPHIGTATMRTRVRMTELGIRNLQAGLDGQPLETTPPV